MRSNYDHSDRTTRKFAFTHCVLPGLINTTPRSRACCKFVCHPKDSKRGRGRIGKCSLWHQIDLDVLEAEQIAEGVPVLCSCRSWNISDDVRNCIQYFTKFVERDTDAVRTCNRRAKNWQDVLTTYYCVLQRGRNVALSRHCHCRGVERSSWELSGRSKNAVRPKCNLSRLHHACAMSMKTVLGSCYVLTTSLPSLLRPYYVLIAFWFNHVLTT